MRVFVSVLIVLLLAVTSFSQELDYCGRCRACLLGDADTGEIIYGKNIDKAYPVGSIVKTMLMLIVAEKVENGELSLKEPVRTSRYASKMGGSQVYLREGEVHTLEDMMKAIAIASANDAAVAVAERVAGSVEGFLDLMKIKAKELGLKDSVFYTVHGLPDRFGREDLMSARDIFKVARELVKYGFVLRWTSIRMDKFRGGKFILYNTNKLLGRFHGLDGLKTGYTSRAKYCFVGTAKRNGVRLIAVALGCDTERDRFRCVARLLNYGFNALKRVRVVKKGEVLRVISLKMGEPERLEVVAAKDFYVYLLSIGRHQVEKKVVLKDGIEPPISKGEKLGVLKILVNGKEKGEVSLVAKESVARISYIRYIIRKLLGS